MVNRSDAPFRALCRAHGATLAVGQMWLAADVMADAGGGVMARAVAGADRPLVVQLAGNDVGVMLAAAVALAPHCDGLDVNLGCPQERAQAGGYGAYMATRRHWPLVERMLRALVAGVPVPVTAKVRLQDTLGDTLDWARLVAGTGVAAITVHGRTRGSAHKRRAGPARLEWVRAVVDAVGGPAGVPVVTNGNVRCHADVHAALAATGADGVMSGEAALEDPGVFACGPECAAGAPRTALPTAQQAGRFIAAYLSLVAAAQPDARPPPPVVAAHVAHFLGKMGHGPATRYRHRGGYASHDLLRTALADAAHNLEALRLAASLAVPVPPLALQGTDGWEALCGGGQWEALCGGGGQGDAQRLRRGVGDLTA
jgi:tRNA-dihydrouridine synthase 1